MIRKDSSPGLDGIEYKMIRLLPEPAKVCLLELFNVVWSSGTLPTEWLNYQVIFIDKAGSEKVRPISLSSCVGKVMERMINERLIWWAEKEDKFSTSQSGFRRGRSCADNLTRIVSDIRASVCAGEYTLAFFLDVASAYDCVDFRITMDKLTALNCPLGIVRFIRNWLYRRKGAVLSPVLYSLVTQGLCADLPEGVEAVEFADDIGLYISGPNRCRNKELLQRAVDIVAERLREIGLDLAPKKSVLVEFSKSGFLVRGLSIGVGDCEVFNSCSAKFLGIWLDNRLKFDRQVTEVRAKVNRANSVIKYLCKVSKGMEVNTALMLYKSLVRSVTDYGSFVYFPRDATLQLKMERSQYLGIRTALGYRNSTPTNVIIAEAKVRYLRDRAMLLGRNFVNKAIAYNRNGLCDKLQRLLDRENYARFRQPQYRMSLLSEIWRGTRTYRTAIGPHRKSEIFQSVYYAHTFRPKVDLEIGKDRKHEGFSDRILVRKVIDLFCLSDTPEIIFTDGSYNENSRSTGASIVICDQVTAYKMSLHYQCSSYTAEAFAVKSALQIMKMQHAERKKDIVIFSDCKSVLQAIYNNHINVHKNKYITEARILIYELEVVHGKNVVLVWIPAHVGITGNEMADALAKEAANEEADPTIEIPVGDLMKCARRETWDATQLSITRESVYKGAFYFQNFYDRAAVIPWFREVNAERYFVTLLNRLRANHYNLGASLKRKGYVDTARCECGYENEDLQHLLTRCHKYDAKRIDMDAELRAEGYLEEIDICRLIKSKKWNILYVIFKFLRHIDKVI
ncbi:uncharacterized protein [Temnothorax nylanderi]|uniref:uncharacterized protein isoform X2 n=1 Tax=Temnothorax nylanderi TaxID=102681 RepID=UPI003A8BD01F